MTSKVTLNLEEIYKTVSGANAKVADTEQYVREAVQKAGEGNIIKLTGGAPIWMYLKIAHALHGKAKKLLYTAPGQGIEEFEIFNHDPN